MTKRVPSSPSPVVAGLVVSSLLWMVPQAALAQAPTPEPRQDPAAALEPRAQAPSAGQVEAALADGDLTLAKELAVALREAEPSVEHHRLEAQVWTALGDFEYAKLALGRALDGLPEDASAEDRRALEAELEALEDASRGTVVDEPESSHRERLDGERADRLAALAPKLEPPPPIVDAPAKAEPIIKKWYFWVTLGAIVASAGAIVGIAVSSNLDDRNSDAASRQPVGPGPMGPGGLVFRF